MHQWSITATQDEGAWLDDYIHDVITNEPPPLPLHDLHVGHVEAHWHQVEPGVVYVAAHGGSLSDEVFVEHLLYAQLRPHGYKRASVSLRWDHDDMRKVAEWNDIENDAKAIVQSGGVTLRRNGYNDVMADVDSQSEPGTVYQTTIKRDDPNSQAITGSTCTCGWGQFQNLPRTRQWKRFQDRPCKHILATYWVSRATPLDEDRNPGGQMSMPGVGGPMAAPGGMTGGPSIAPFRMSPTAPSGQINPAQMQLGMPGGGMTPGIGQPPSPWQTPPTPGVAPTPESALPQFPMDPSLVPQHNPISTPGGKDLTPLNPIQYPPGPGGTFSSWRPDRLSHVAQTTYRNGDRVELLHEDKGTLVGRSEAHGAGQEASIPQGQIGEVLGTHPSTGMVNVLYMGNPWDQSGEMEPYGATAWHFPSSVRLRSDIRAPGPAIHRPRGTF